MKRLLSKGQRVIKTVAAKLKSLPRVSYALPVVLVAIAIGMLFQSRGLPGKPDCSGMPSITVTKDLPITDNYRVWVLSKSETDSLSSYVSVDGGACQQLNMKNSEDWNWVGGSRSAIMHELSAGKHEFTFSIEQGSALIDKFLVTNEEACVPKNQGKNCIELPIDFDVVGVAPGDILKGKKQVSTQFVNPENIGLKVQYAFDEDATVHQDTSAPYCLVDGEKECGEYDFSKLGEGTHALKVHVTSIAGQQQTKEIPFTVSVQDAVNTDSQSTTDKALEVSINGIKDGDVLKGEVEANAVLSDPAYKPVLTYRLDGVILNTRNKPPYCLGTQKADNTCEKWDTAALADGEHELVAMVPRADGSAPNADAPEIWESVKFTVQNGVAQADQVNEDEVTQMVILGNGRQQAAGLSTITIPKEKQSFEGVTAFFVNNHEIAKVKGDTQSIPLDTTGYVNGKYIISATVKYPDGSIEILASDVHIQNNFFTSMMTWVRQNKVLALLSVVAIGAAVFVLSFITNRYIRHRRFIRSHKMADYDKTTEEVLFKFFNRMPHLNPRVSALLSIIPTVLVVGGLLTLLLLNKPMPVAGIGFIAEIEEGITSENSKFVLETDEGMKEQYIRIQDDQAAETSSNKNFIVGHSGEHNAANNESQSQEEKKANKPKASTGGSSGGGGQSGGGGSQAACTPGTLSTHGPCVNESLIPAGKTGHNSVRMDSCAPTPPGDGWCVQLAGNGEPGAFRQRCDFSHMNFDDPILFPSQPKRAHLHAFFGNNNTNAYSTSSSLRNSGRSTCAGGTFNRSAYWVPAMVDRTTGRPIAPNDNRSNYHSDLEIYYKLGYQGVSPQEVRAFPNGLHMIAGHPANATGPTTDGWAQGTVTEYWCENLTEPRQHLTAHTPYMPVCGANQILTMAVKFPQCWDGRLTSPNGRSHLAYGTWDSGWDGPNAGCPSSHPYGLPFIELFIRYATGSSSTANWRLSSDNYNGGPAGYSGHADYMFAWDESAFPTVIQRCYRGLVDCSYSLGDGRNPRDYRAQ